MKVLTKVKLVIGVSLGLFVSSVYGGKDIEMGRDALSNVSVESVFLALSDGKTVDEVRTESYRSTCEKRLGLMREAAELPYMNAESIKRYVREHLDEFPVKHRRTVGVLAAVYYDIFWGLTEDTIEEYNPVLEAVEGYLELLGYHSDALWAERFRDCLHGMGVPGSLMSGFRHQREHLLEELDAALDGK